MDAPPENDYCSVCHENFRLPCQANCSHWFCGECILQVWHHGSALEACKCPICRRLITLLIPSESMQHQRHELEVGRVLGDVERYNRLFGGGSRSLIQKSQTTIEEGRLAADVEARVAAITNLPELPRTASHKDGNVGFAVEGPSFTPSKVVEGTNGSSEITSPCFQGPNDICGKLIK
ncbi:hypothetical protein Taro_005104 [Colocasia esculenta]|uniref:RING-type domain-containing protein n=1 Tax=Colocasia esculenta TaxID=4460 RepID=A0A843TTN8_COLES|nr:hypothetical protein [Colocasia esculenta]